MEEKYDNEIFNASDNISPLNYNRLVMGLNLLVQDKLSKELSKYSENLGRSVVFITPGSDGRLEKGSIASPLEIIAILDDEVDIDKYKKQIESVFNKVSSTRIAKIEEIKKPSSKLSDYKDTRRKQPGRLADSQVIYGLRERIQDLKKKLGRELFSMSNNEVGNVADFKRSARKVSEEGKNRIAGVDAIHFDLENGMVFFNPNSYQASFKIGPLRLVQNTLLIEEIRHIRRENNTDFISQLESNVVERLTQLSDDKMVNLERESIEEIKEHYAFFLRLYHKSERLYELKQQTVLKLDPGEIMEISKRLKALTGLIDKFKIIKKSSVK